MHIIGPHADPGGIWRTRIQCESSGISPDQSRLPQQCRPCLWRVGKGGPPASTIYIYIYIWRVGKGGPPSPNSGSGRADSDAVARRRASAYSRYARAALSLSALRLRPSHPSQRFKRERTSHPIQWFNHPSQWPSHPSQRPSQRPNHPSQRANHPSYQQRISAAKDFGKQ
jgi:hypothetical protein